MSNPINLGMALKPKHLLWIVLASVVARFLCSAVDMQVWVDSRAYLNSAQALLDGRWADFYVERTPGYPLFLIAHMLLVKGLWPSAQAATLHNLVGITQALLGVLIALLTADITCRLFKKPRLALAAGLLAALSPNLILAEHALLTETLYAFSLLLTLWLWVRLDRQPTPAGLLGVGLACGWLLWVRPLGLVFPVVAGWLLWQRRPDWRPIVALAGPVILIAALWVGFQWQAHQYLGLTAGGGLNQLYKTVEFVQYATPEHAQFKNTLAQRRQLYPPGSAQAEAVNDTHVLHYLDVQGKQPYWQVYLEDDRTARAISMEAIAARPFQYLGVTIREAWRLLTEPSPWDPQLIFWTPLLLLSLVGSAWLWRAPAYRLQGRLLVLTLWGQMALYPLLTVSTARYRVPLEPLVMMLAAYGAYRLYRSMRRFRSDSGAHCALSDAS